MAKKQSKAKARPTPQRPPSSPQAEPASPGLKQVSLEELKKFHNPTLPTLAADSTEVMIRGDLAGVPQTAMLRFYTMFPETALEIARVIITADHMRAIVDLFSRSLNYFPEKPENDETRLGG